VAEDANLKGPAGNALLDALPPADHLLLKPHLTHVALQAGQILAIQGESVRYVYFPTTGFVSCRASGSEGETVEIYAVGNDGVVEPASILTSISAVTAEVQIAGEAYQIAIEELCHAFPNAPELTRVLLKYAYSLAIRMVQATKCALFHTVQQRLVLWLLLAVKAHGTNIPCTHQSIADALGTRRASVTQVLATLANKSILEIKRGRVIIQDRQQLEAAACDCFQLIKAAQKPELECDLVPAQSSAK
jgi:CRP-like cAMP-binding protein